MIGISCSCGWSAQVPDSYAGKRGKCPKCKEKIPVPSLMSNVPENPPRKNCDFCGESILKTANKCRYCGEYLNPALRNQSTPQPIVINEPTSTSNPGVAMVCSFLIPGLGQIYKGQVFNGLAWLCLTALGYVCFIVPGVILHICCIIGAGMNATNRKAGVSIITGICILMVPGIIVALLLPAIQSAKQKTESTKESASKSPEKIVDVSPINIITKNPVVAQDKNKTIEEQLGDLPAPPTPFEKSVWNDVVGIASQYSWEEARLFDYYTDSERFNVQILGSVDKWREENLKIEIASTAYGKERRLELREQLLQRHDITLEQLDDIETRGYTADVLQFKGYNKPTGWEKPDDYSFDHDTATKHLQEVIANNPTYKEFIASYQEEVNEAMDNFEQLNNRRHQK